LHSVETSLTPVSKKQTEEVSNAVVKKGEEKTPEKKASYIKLWSGKKSRPNEKLVTDSEKKKKSSFSSFVLTTPINIRKTREEEAKERLKSEIGLTDMETFVSRSLEKIKKATRGRHPEIKAACDRALAKIAQVKKKASAPRSQRENAEQYWEPFKLACESQNAHIMEEALDCLQKLIAYGYLRGTARRAPVREDGKQNDGLGAESLDGNDEESIGVASSMDEIVGTICGCDDFDDDNVQLQVIKALLTAVTSNTCEIHEGSLLIAVRSCYNIHLVTKNQVNKTTAKATLTQMLSIVFQRMEAYDQRALIAAAGGDTTTSTNPIVPPPAVLVKDEDQSNKEQAVTEAVVEAVADAVAEAMTQQGAAMAQKCEFVPGDEVSVPGFGDGELKELRHDGSCAVALHAWRHEDGRPALLYAKASILRASDKASEETNPQIISEQTPPQGASLTEDGDLVVQSDMESSGQQQYFDEDDEEDEDEEEDGEDDTTPHVGLASAQDNDFKDGTSSSLEQLKNNKTLAHATPFASPYHKDAFLLFRALCKLSMKDHDDVETPAEPISMQSKALSLELLLSVLEHAGPSFRNGARFVAAVRQYLCVSLLKNCTSNVTHVVALSLRIFVCLVVKLRDHLKAEVEVFISHIFLRVLDSDNSTHEHKMLVLEVFHNLCTDAQGLVEIFLSYDANFDSVDIFRHIVVALARVVKGRTPDSSSQAGASAEAIRRAVLNDSALRRLALAGLVATLRSLAACCEVPLPRLALAASSDPLEDLGDEEGQRLSVVGSSGPSPQMQQISSDTSSSSRSRTQTKIMKKMVPGLRASQQEYDSDNASSASGTPRESGSGSGGIRPRKTLAPPDDDDDTKSVSSSHGGGTMSSVEAYDLKQRIQEELREGILQFNINPKQGIALLAKKGHLEMTPPSVARFLRTYAGRLNKTKIGEYLGREKEYQNGFCFKVLHEYVDQLDFTGMDFDVAIRHFLAGFRLPGEAQKIDRMMENFAERYCMTNKTVFPSADVAFVLAFSIIMLQTDLHNPAIKEERKMTKESFRRNNRGICDGKDLDPDFLDAIFDRIKSTPITLEEDDKKRNEIADKNSANGSSATSVFLGLGANPSRRKAEAFHREREDMVRASVTLLRQPRDRVNSSQQLSVLDAEPAASAAAAAKMFEVAWGPALSAFSHALERLFVGPGPTSFALQGLQISACVAAVLGLDVARESVVNALASFTTLYHRTSRPLLPRNAACIEALLALPEEDECADNLGSSWLPILQIASRVAHLRLLAQGLHTDDAFFTGLDEASDDKHLAAARQRDVDGARALASLTRLTDSDIDKLYARSTRLSAVGVESFVIQLCAVSAAELSTGDALDAGAGNAKPTTPVAQSASHLIGEDADYSALVPLGTPLRPRVYSLQRLVDVADANVTSRPRLAWDRIWRVLAIHFARAGAHANADVAKYAVDSLRQLSLKFLNKEELTQFSFQRSFLRPFEKVFAAALRNTEHPNRAAVREYVVECVDALVLSRASSIRSGWRSIFAVYTMAANDDDTTVTDLAYRSLDRVVSQYLDLVARDFVELVNCVVAFAAAPRARPQVALAALNRLDECSIALADGKISAAAEQADLGIDAYVATAVPVKATETVEANKKFSDARLELWWPLLLGLAQRVADPRVAVRNAALATLRRVLERDCHNFTAETWRLVFRGVLFPSLESAWTDDVPQPNSTRPTDAAPDPSSAPRDESSWLTSTAPALLETCVALYAARGGSRDSSALLGELFGALGDCVCQDVEALSRLAVDALKSTLDAIATINPPRDTWDTAVHGLASLVKRALPAELCDYLESVAAAQNQMPIAQGGPSAVISPQETEKAIADETFEKARRLAERLPRPPTIARLVASLRLLPLCDAVLVTAADREALDDHALDAMLDALAESRRFARAFNSDGVLRFALFEQQFMGAAEAPDLVAQNVDAGAAALDALKALRDTPNLTEVAQPRLLSLCRDLLHEYSLNEINKQRELQDQDKHKLLLPTSLQKASTPLALDALSVVKTLDSDTFSLNCSWLVPVLSELIVCSSVEIRTAVAAVFACRLPVALQQVSHQQQIQPATLDTAPIEPQPPRTPETKTGAKTTVDSTRPTPRHPGAVVKPYHLFQ